MRGVAICLLLVCLFVLVFAHPLANSKLFGRKILLQNQIIDTRQEPSNAFVHPQDDQRQRQILLHVQPPVSPKMLKTLQAKFGNAQYVPHNTFLVVTSLSKLKEVIGKKTDAFLWIGEVRPKQKLSEELLKTILEGAKKSAQDDSMSDATVNSSQTLEVLLDSSEQDAEAVAKAWTSELQKQSLPAQIAVGSKKKLLVQIKDIARMASIVDLLASQASAKHIQAKESYGTFEDEMSDDPTYYARFDPLSDEFREEIFKKASSAIETSKESKSSILKGDWVGQPSLPDVQYLWSLGLDGRDEVIGIGDTGLDYMNCFFSDPKGEVPFNKVADTHRKVKAYWTFADDKDRVRGHGSHINSIVAGESEEQPMLNGVIPKAKIAFVDIGLPGGGLKIPADLSTDYFPLNHKATNIMSNSWGNKRYGQYTLGAREVDDYAYNNKDFLIIYAAGNSGREGGATITPPGTAKNAITVGAAQGSWSGYELGIPLYAELLLQQMKDQMCGKSSGLLSDSECGAFGFDAPCSDGMNAICDNIKSTKDCCANPFLKKMCCTEYMLANLKKHPELYNPANAAVFSSRGPTKDNRIKPDIVAHGQPVFGARSMGTPDHFHCPTPLVMQGTSQAAPIIAGFAVMAKQYFKKGYYPSGQPNEADGFTPTGALLKATIINSGVNLPGKVDLNGQEKWTDLKPTPSFTQGFGRASLTNGLPFPGRNNFTYVKEESEVSTGDKVELCFQVDNEPGKEFKTTLVWMDPPASPNAVITLVNNLDLLVQTEKGKVYHGNGGLDYVNTVEQVSLSTKKSSGKKLKVIVHGTHVPQGPQSFALVATGNMKKIDCASANFAPIEMPKPHEFTNAEKENMGNGEEALLLKLLAGSK